jgi:hypothetical protein
MYRIVEAVRQTDLDTLLDDMRSWLEHNGCDSVHVTTRKETAGIAVVQVEFDRSDLAEAFTEVFEAWGLFPALVYEPGRSGGMRASASQSLFALDTPKACQPGTGFGSHS